MHSCPKSAHELLQRRGDRGLEIAPSQVRFGTDVICPGWRPRALSCRQGCEGINPLSTISFQSELMFCRAFDIAKLLILKHFYLPTEKVSRPAELSRF